MPSVQFYRDFCSILYSLSDLCKHGIFGNLLSMTLCLWSFNFMQHVFGEILKGNKKGQRWESLSVFFCLMEGVELQVCSSVNIRDSSRCNASPQNKQRNDLISLCLRKGSGGQWVCVYGREWEWLRRTIDLARVDEFSNCVLEIERERQSEEELDRFTQRPRCLSLV